MTTGHPGSSRVQHGLSHHIRESGIIRVLRCTFEFQSPRIRSKNSPPGASWRPAGWFKNPSCSVELIVDRLERWQRVRGDHHRGGGVGTRGCNDWGTDDGGTIHRGCLCVAARIGCLIHGLHHGLRSVIRTVRGAATAWLAAVVTHATEAAAAASRIHGNDETSQQKRDLFGHDASFVFDPSGQEWRCDLTRRVSCDRWENRPARRSDSGEAAVIYLTRPKCAKTNLRDFRRETEISLKFRRHRHIFISSSTLRRKLIVCRNA